MLDPSECSTTSECAEYIDRTYGVQDLFELFSHRSTRLHESLSGGKVISVNLIERIRIFSYYYSSAESIMRASWVKSFWCTSRLIYSDVSRLAFSSHSRNAFTFAFLYYSLICDLARDGLVG